MFFRKPIQKQQSLGRIALIGDSPLAFLLAHILQCNNFEVFFPTASSKMVHQSVSFTLKTDSLQTKHFYVNYTDTLPASADFCCLASSPESYKKDFLLTQTLSSKTTPILNFSYLFNKTLFEAQNTLNIFPVYPSCWINLEKNILEVLSGKITFEICCPSKEFSTYENLFAGPLIEIKNISKPQPIFWQHLIPYTLSNLLICTYQEAPLVVLKQKEVRTLLSNALKELSVIAKNNGETIKESEVLAYLYTIPDKYKSEFLPPKSIITLENLLPEISYFDTPSLYKLFSLANKP